jgi:hypothetical protein
MIAAMVFLTCMVSIAFADADQQGQSTSSDSEEPDVIFAIGQEDKRFYEFCSKGFKGHPEYTCRVGVVCSSEVFPMRLYRAPIPEYEDNGVERVTIIFTLDHGYKNAVLRLVRAGGETTVVRLDEDQTFSVTAEMLGSQEGWVFGAYNLMLGALKKGTHTIQLTVADDGKGNGRCNWDALMLFAE